MKLQTQEYEGHLEEVQAGLAEYYKNRNEIDYEWRHKIGRLLLEYAEANNVSLRKHVQRVAQDLQREMRTVYYMAQFAKKFPKLEDAPLHQPWREVVHQYLPEVKKEKDPCKHCPIHCK